MFGQFAQRRVHRFGYLAALERGQHVRALVPYVVQRIVVVFLVPAPAPRRRRSKARAPLPAYPFLRDDVRRDGVKIRRKLRARFVSRGVATSAMSTSWVNSSRSGGLHHAENVVQHVHLWRRREFGEGVLGARGVIDHQRFVGPLAKRSPPRPSTLRRAACHSRTGLPLRYR